MIIAPDVDTAQFAAVLRTALDAVVVMRTDGTVAGWNDVARATFGWSFAEVEGRRMSELIIPHRYQDAHEQGLTHYLATGEGPVIDRRIEIEALHRDGHEIPVELSITRTSEFGVPVFLGFLRDISERRAAERRQELLVGELNHRVKNLLSVVSAIAQQTLRTTPSPEEFAGAFLARLESLARAHEILTAASWERASLRALVDAAFESLGDSRQVEIDGPDLLLSPRQFLSLNMIVHELLTNALKYGALSHAGGRIALDWSFDGQEVELYWRETGGRGIAAPQKRGFGTRMIALSVSHELGGELETDWRGEGVICTVRFSLE
ncbi:MAG TPA: HWE histidine kinase domain-containing protein [Qipengyuania sp.]|nr:HWE histidine kinase domain-containing protein [Qipengyuania sp.]